MLEHLYVSLAILLIVVTLDIVLAGEQPTSQRQFTAEERETIQKAIAWRDDKRCTIL
jgi:hypothetical protein